MKVREARCIPSLCVGLGIVLGLMTLREDSESAWWRFGVGFLMAGSLAAEPLPKAVQLPIELSVNTVLYGGLAEAVVTWARRGLGRHP